MPRLPTSRRSLTCAALFALMTSALASTTSGQMLHAQKLSEVSLSAVAPAVAPLYARSGMPSPKYAVKRYRLKVQSSDEAGRPIRVNALLYVPVMPQGERAPLYVMGPGTTGLADACAPTREQVSHDNWGNYEAHMLSYAAQGYVGILPDWAHFDDPERVQPYFVAAAEGRVMLDAARAARGFLAKYKSGARPAPHTFLAGFSQGGHAAFSAADLAHTYAPDVKISGVIGYAPAMDVATLFRERPALGPYLAHSYASYYGADAAKILQPRFLNALKDEAARWCVSELYRKYPNAGESIYRPEFLAALKSGTMQNYDRSLAQLMTRNAPGFAAGGRAIPALVLTGLTDPIVTADAQLTFMRKSCAFGRSIVQRGYANANHFQARQFGFQDTLSWMRDVANGKPAPTSCLEAKYQMPGKVTRKAQQGTPVFASEQR